MSLISTNWESEVSFWVDIYLCVLCAKKFAKPMKERNDTLMVTLRLPSRFLRTQALVPTVTTEYFLLSH